MKEGIHLQAMRSTEVLFVIEENSKDRIINALLSPCAGQEERVRAREGAKKQHPPLTPIAAVAVESEQA